MVDTTGVAKSIINAWNTNVIPALGNVVPRNITVGAASSLREVVKQAGSLTISLTKLLARATLSSATTHPYVAVIVVVTIVIPMIREYCATNGNRGMIRAIPVVAWMMITRPFKLAYRILTAITGGAEVDKQKLQQKITQLKGLKPILDVDLQAKQQAVTVAINSVTIPNVKETLSFTFGEITVNNCRTIIASGSIANSSCKTTWEFLQKVLTENKADANIRAVKTALDDWEKCLNMRISVE
jgi:hypothetical protein